MRYTTAIRALGGRRSLPGARARDAAPSLSALRCFGHQRRFPTADPSWSGAAPPPVVVTLAAAASALAASLVISREGDDRSRSAQCSAIPTPSTSTSSPTTQNTAVLADRVNDIHDVYKLGDIIGEGGYGQVYHATRVADSTPVALKCIPKEYTDDDAFAREVDVLRRLNLTDGGHRHICRMYDICETEDEYWMSLELIEGGELFEHLIEEGAYSEARAAVFLRQFAEALAFMHNSGVVHGDLKPENLLLSSWDCDEAELKLVDFGCSVILDKCKSGDGSQSTWAYDPPEKLADPSYPPSFKSDVWAAGCILYVILTGSHPFDKSCASSEEEMVQRVKDIGTSEEKMSALAFDERVDGLSPSAIGLLYSMLQPDPERRPTAEQVRRNAWVQGLTASWAVMDGIDGRLERFWRKEFQSNIVRKFGGVVTDERLLSVFTQIDEDGNGSIELEELAKVLEEAGTKPKYVRSIFDAINLDHDKGISFEEFKCVMRNELPAQFYQAKFRNLLRREIQTDDASKRSEPLRAASRRLFNSMDLDNNGELDCHELRLLLRKLGVDEKEISDLVASVDLDKDGTLTFVEFSKVVFGARTQSSST